MIFSNIHVYCRRISLRHHFPGKAPRAGRLRHGSIWNPISRRQRRFTFARLIRYYTDPDRQKCLSGKKCINIDKYFATAYNESENFMSEEMV